MTICFYYVVAQTMMPDVWGNQAQALKNTLMNVLGGEKQNWAIKIWLYAHPVGVSKELEISPLTTGVAQDTIAVHRVLELTKFRNSCIEIRHIFQ